VNYLALFAAGVGLFTVGRRWLRRRRTGRMAVACAVLFSAASVSVLTYLPTHIENRYSLPAQALLAPFVAYGAGRVAAMVRSSRWRSLAVLATLLALFLTGCVWLSCWLRAQAPLLREPTVLTRPKQGLHPFDKTAQHGVNSRK